MLISSPSIALLSALALASQLAGQAEAGFFDGAEEIFEQAKTIEPVECGNALLELGNIWVTDRDCIKDFDKIVDFFEGIKLPNLSIDGFEVMLDRGVLPDVPVIDYEGLCANGACIAKVADLHATIDEACKPDVWETITPDIVRILKATRAFTDVICIKDEDGDYCLDSFISDLKDYSPLSNDTSATGIRENLCSDCSKEIQAGLFGSLGEVPKYAYATALMYCTRDEDKEFCPKRELLMGVSKALVPAVAWGVVYDDEDICGSSCAAEAVVLAGGEPPEQCFEEEDEVGALSYAFEFVGQKTGLRQEDVTEVIVAMKEDVGSATGLFNDYVDVFLDEGERFVIRLEKKFAKIDRNNRELFVETEKGLETATKLSPFLETNQVAGKVIEDPTKSLKIKEPEAAQETKSGAPRASSVAAFALVAAAFGAVAL